MMIEKIGAHSVQNLTVSSKFNTCFRKSISYVVMYLRMLMWTIKIAGNTLNSNLENHSIHIRKDCY